MDRTRHARLELRQFQEVPAVERQIFHLLAAHDAAHLVLHVVEQRCGARHRRRLAQVADLDGEVDGCGRSGLEACRACRALESRRLRGHAILAWRQRLHAVPAVRRCDGGAFLPGLAIRDLDVYFGDGRTSGIGHDAGDGACRRLRIGRTDGHKDEEEHRRRSVPGY